jgi:hypothetical protein
VACKIEKAWDTLIKTDAWRFDSTKSNLSSLISRDLPFGLLRRGKFLTKIIESNE